MSSPCPADPVKTDPRLLGFLTAASRAQADQELTRLMQCADPLIAGCLERRARGGNRTDTEDAISEARTRLVLRLQRLREDGAAPRVNGGGATISDFGAYAVTVACMAWAQQARRRNPARAMLLNRLRYLLEGRTNQRGFAVWTGPGGETWAGFEKWRGRWEGAVPERAGRLLADPRAVRGEVLGPAPAGAALPLAELVSRLFAWLGGPLRVRDLTNAVGEWQEIPVGRAGALSLDACEETAPAACTASGASPHDALRWKEYLLWLRDEAARLTTRQRQAFLLHSSCLREMEALGLTSVRQAAASLEIPPARLAEHWGRLPLEDRVIGALLGLEIQQVINLRKVARTILGRAWHGLLQEK